MIVKITETRKNHLQVEYIANSINQKISVEDKISLLTS